MGLKDSKLSVSPSPSNASSNTSLMTPPTGTPPPEVRLMLNSDPHTNILLNMYNAIDIMRSKSTLFLKRVTNKEIMQFKRIYLSVN